MMHAVSRDTSSFPKPCIYIQLDDACVAAGSGDMRQNAAAAAADDDGDENGALCLEEMQQGDACCLCCGMHKRYAA
eukprot:scaffold127528_cov21-Tisochrysis_lutea.AAC.1